MYETKQSTPIISANGIDYYTNCNQSLSPGTRRFGITAASSSDSSDTGTAENLFFTKEEAEAYCRFFAENQVFPYTLREVLANILVI